MKLGNAKLLICAGLLACSSGVEPNDSPLVGLANRLDLQGEWAWTDSTGYVAYLPKGDSVPHHGWYVVSGTAVIERIDSVDEESYTVAATARLDHLDSTTFGEMANWFQADLEFVDTVLIRGDTIFGLFVLPIPPESNPNTDRIKWQFSAEELWCTNWLDRPAVSSPYNTECLTSVDWIRTGKGTTGGTDSTGTGGDSTSTGGL